MYYRKSFYISCVIFIENDEKKNLSSQPLLVYFLYFVNIIIPSYKVVSKCNQSNSYGLWHTHRSDTWMWN